MICLTFRLLGQIIIKGILMEILKFSVPEIIFGRGSLKYAGSFATRLGDRKRGAFIQ